MKKTLKKSIIILMLLLLCITFTACNNNESNTQILNNTIEKENEIINEYNTENTTIEAQQNTSQKVDEIAKRAKKDAENITPEKQKEALQYIKNNKSNFFKSNEVMEQSMYYGYLLEYAYKNSDKSYAKLGQDVYQAIKYVYRGIEKVEDSATQENLQQIEKDLKQIK